MTLRVAVVAPSMTARMALSESLASLTVESKPFASASRLLEEVGEEGFDVVVLSTSLEDGAVAAEAIRQKEPGCLLIAWGHPPDERSCFDRFVEDIDDVVKVVSGISEPATSSDARPILVIDDSLTFRETLSEALRGMNFDVVATSNAEEGLRLAARVRPQAFVVDGQLPGMSGSDFIRRIKLDHAFRGLPCVLLTAAQESEAEVVALDSGADAFVRKEEDPEVMLAKLARALHSPVQSANDEIGERPLDAQKVLAVDDSLTFRHRLVDELSSEGYSVLQASSGEEALEIVRLHDVDCILLDLMMPGIGGKETCRRLKKSPKHRSIPVLVLTAVEEREAMLEGLATGADDYIQKTSEMEVVKARVRAQLRRRQFEEQARSIREHLMKRELHQAEARAALELAETREVLVDALEKKNAELEEAYSALKSAQAGFVQAAKMVSLGELVAGVAHEINNPLTFVASHVDTVLRCLERCERDGLTLTEASSPHWEKARVRLGEIATGLGRMQELVVKLRTFSRLDEGERKPASIKDCVDSVITILRHRITRSVELKRSFTGPDVIDCYPGLLNQVMLNLVSNALDAIDERGIIEIKGSVVGSDYRLEVRDDGPGIPDELVDRVFEPFFTTKAVGKGTGLGLSISYSIAQRHGGSLVIERGKERGTVFVLSFPLTPV